MTEGMHLAQNPGSAPTCPYTLHFSCIGAGIASAEIAELFCVPCIAEHEQSHVLWLRLSCGQAADSCMQGMHVSTLLAASEAISYALGCAGRCTGPCTMSIRICTQVVARSLDNTMGQPEALTGSSILANVVCLELALASFGVLMHDDCVSVSSFVRSLLQRVPNLLAARLWCYPSPYVSYRPMSQLKHLDLGSISPDSLSGMQLATLFPELQTLNISTESLGTIPELDVSGCQHLKWLVLYNVMVCRVLKPAQCRFRAHMVGSDCGMEAVRLQPGLLEANEVLICGRNVCPPEGIFPGLCLPKLEVIRCEWDIDDGRIDGTPEIVLGLCLQHSKELPALKSIFCGDYGMAHEPVMKARIPADLAGVQELIIATDRPLLLYFDSASNLGARLNTFYVVAREVRVDIAALLDMTDALSKRGLTLSMARAGQGNINAPSHCMYVRAISAPQLSYEDAIDYVNARVEKWGKHHDDCAQCGACFDCLEKAGLLDCSSR